jgi:poly-beta-1,6-N-acetyl-D-glucosamine synthase
MQSIMNTLTSEIIFWTAWIIIPLIMEIIPATFGFLVLLRKQNKYRKDPILKYFPEITVIVPVYNSADTLELCICSILESTYPADKIEVLLVNNGSRDNSFEIFQSFQASNPGANLKWMNSRQGKSKALNMALFNSEGKYIIHLDSDGTLQRDALLNLITRFEAHEEIHCMTGSILTNPDMINSTKPGLMKIIRKVEFFEYAQAFLAGRNFEAEMNNIFTISGAFSAFRKSTILKTQLYNTETVCEDTQVTFQIRHLLKKKIDICESAIFFVDPIASMDSLYVQRQRWQRGEIEVAHMFPPKSGVIKGFFTDMMTRLILFDHTFAFPRMIWYFALICLAFMNYPFAFVIESSIIIYALYTFSTFLYYLNVRLYLSWDKDLKKFYQRKIIYVIILPIFNFIVYWFRMAGIINSIKGVSTWRTKTFKEEREQCKSIVSNDFRTVGRMLHWVRLIISSDK